MYDLSFDTIKNLKDCNHALRLKLRDEARAFSSEFERMQHVCKKLLTEYEFNYSELYFFNELDNGRQHKTKKFNYNGKEYKAYAIDMKSAIFDIDEEKPNETPVFHYVHALKMGVCKSFAHEIEWFAKEFGLKSEIVVCDTIGYDGWVNPKGEYTSPVLTKQEHFYNVVNLDGVEYKIDIAGALMAKDYGKRFPNSQVSPQQFVMVDKNAKNPFVVEYQKQGNQFGEEE